MSLMLALALFIAACMACLVVLAFLSHRRLRSLERTVHNWRRGQW